MLNELRRHGYEINPGTLVLLVGLGLVIGLL